MQPVSVWAGVGASGQERLTILEARRGARVVRTIPGQFSQEVLDDKWEFGITMMIVGMGGTLLTLWILSLVMSLLKKIFPSRPRSRPEKRPDRQEVQNGREHHRGSFGLVVGITYLFSRASRTWSWLLVGGVLLFLGVKKEVEPLLLVPIGFGCVLVNIPLSDLMEQGGLLKIFYDMGIANELFPASHFCRHRAMTDFTPSWRTPRSSFSGPRPVRIFLTLLLALALGFPELEAVSIAIIGACDGPTAIYVTSQYAPQLLGAVSVAAYSYMALVPSFSRPS